MKFTSTKDCVDTVNVFVYGPPGIGKTVLCSTAPDPIIISSEKGLMSIASFDIPVIEIENIDDLKEAYQVVKKSKKFKTVCLDSISDIAETCLTDMKKNHKDLRKAYGDLQDEISDICRKFRDLPINTYVVGKVISEADGSNNKLSMPSKRLANDIPYIFDLVLPMRLADDGEETYRYLQTQPDLLWYAKDRSGVLSPIEKPDLGYIFDKVAKKIKGAKNGKGKKEKKGKKGKKGKQ